FVAAVLLPRQPDPTPALSDQGQGIPRPESSAPDNGPVDPPPDGAVARFGTPRLQDFTIDRSTAFSPDGKLLTTSGANSPSCVWDVATGKLVRTRPNRGSVFDLRWKPDGKL